ncbi:ubiquitin carboxyl-terminal hydrolase 8 isoform X2 [Ctenocephalides felis]|uniref:ubiquitin carboxyl-terminal hydrolase 8 isoform X2 n=1 Tax=Ctenocephalides felis TaxID=7515 RepID=UPI000E6E2E7A|nr:ubiquitin carboxyl-terminal hydrolase 8 isoform X2 [Ctenocephalides felis]
MEPKKELYLAKCMDELNKKHGFPNLKQKKCKFLCTTANKAYDQAYKHYILGDEEQAYTFFMKYLNLINTIRNSTEYNNNKADINRLLDAKQVQYALNYAEELSQSLKERYTILKEQEESKKISEYNNKEPISEDIENDVQSLHVPNSCKAGSNNPKFIACAELYQIIANAHSHSYLIIDTRKSDDYKNSHIMSKYIINLPKEEIAPGKSANQLVLCLGPTELSLWDTRSTKEHIILIDLEGDPGNLSQALCDTHAALVHWDPQAKYKHAPVILKGGYAEFVVMYPTLCLNPKEQISSSPDFKDILDTDVTYPFNDMTITNLQPTNLKPSIDRNSKSAALKLYEERKRKKTDLLREHEKIVDNSILLEKSRLDAENYWETLRKSREMEAEEEKRLAIQEELQILQQQILQMDSFQRDKIMENEALRKQLEEYKHKEMESLENKIDKTIIDQENNQFELDAKRIEKKERERQKLEQQRENLAKERQRKLDEAKAMKQESLRKYAETSSTSLSDEPATNAKMKRSLSTPNVAQMDLDTKVINNIPQYDRAVKPSIHQYDTSVKRDVEIGVAKGLCGLKNLGNTCYMNSIIQCLSNTNYLVRYFCDGSYREHLNRSNETKGRIAEEVATVITSLWSGHYRAVAIREFKNTIGQYNKLFRGCGQQDSHEFLMILIDLLHFDLQTCRPKSSLDNLSPSEKAWKEYVKDRESIILKLFYGQIRSTVTCMVCAKESVTFDTFSNLSLELPPTNNRCSLSDCLSLYLNGERISGWKCPECKAKREAVKKLDISRLPMILVIHFKRFYADSFSTNVYHKKQTYIDFPLFDLHVATQEPSRRYAKYNLYAVSNHYGSMESGHYTAYCKSKVYDKWYKFDDQIVSQIDQNDVNSSAAYILFYIDEKQAGYSRT